MGMWPSGIVAVHVACLLARRSSSWEAGDVERKGDQRLVWVGVELGWDDVGCRLDWVVV